MPSAYIGIGLDHGTCNSGIAVMEKTGPRVVKVNGVDSYMPSAVYMYNQGRELVGWPAYRAMMENHASEGTGYTGYKLRIGQNDTYSFMDGKKKLTAPELGARVIRSLLAAYQEHRQQDPADLPKACVITVPAIFDQSATDGTREAARLAGLSHYPLLQEPIAASLAYGFTANDDRGQWIVFDIGAGTLDISLVIVRKGQMIVPEEGHAGDDRLGGRKFDAELLDHVVAELSKTYALDGFASDPQFEQARNRLLLAVERAKIELSKREQAIVELDDALCKDRRGKPVEVMVPVTRKEYEKLITPDIEKAVQVCQTLITRNHLHAKDIGRIILVGGPSRTPFLQRTLTERLQISLESSIDPMTAVAMGAAIYSATSELPDNLSPQIVVPVPASGETSIQMEYQAYSKVPTYEVAGRVSGPAVAMGDCAVEIRRTDGGWSSGRIPVDESGTFFCTVMLTESTQPKLSEFTTTVYDAGGTQLVCVQEPAIWYPFTDTEDAIKAATSLRVAVRGNDTDVLIRAGAPLTPVPARGRGRFVTRKAIAKGSKEVLRIPILETVSNLLGKENELADTNFLVGTLTIEGGDTRLKQSLPEESELEVTLYQDDSRTIRAVAYIPLLDEEFETTFAKEAFGVSLDQIAARVAELKARLKDARDLHRTKPIPEVEEALKVIDRLSIEASIDKDVVRAQAGDRDATYRAYKHSLELAGTLNAIFEWQRRSRIEKRIGQLKTVCKDLEEAELDSIRKDWSGTGSPSTQTMERVEKSLNDLDNKVRVRPCFELFLDIRACSGRRVSAHQNEVFNEACKLLDALGAKGGAAAADDADLQAFIRMHERVAEAYPELNEWRREALEKIIAEGGSTDTLDISDISRAR